MPSFHVTGDVSSDEPDAVGPVLQLLVTGTVVRTSDGFHIDGDVEGEDVRDANRELLSALRRAERRTRLRAEWTDGGVVRRFFDYVPKGTRSATSG